ncbi:MAG: hypothetical protein OQK24_09595 [Magnetovibrio sp.]|nr:hypothetical protein [Magnetovibrio sp.]
MRKLLTTAVMMMALSIMSTETFAEGSKPFSATAVQAANGQEQVGKLFVSDQGVRYEYVERGREMIKIVLHKEQVMRILFPQEKQFIEIKAPAGTPAPGMENEKPCPPVDGLVCEKVADAKFGNLAVEQWSQTHAPSKTSSKLWWEPVRKMVVRQEYSTGQIMQLTRLEDVDFEGRSVEHWDVSFATPDGKVSKMSRYIDMDIGIIVKVDDPARGMKRELRNVKVATDDQGWFSVPQGYQRIKAPKAPGATMGR